VALETSRTRRAGHVADVLAGALAVALVLSATLAITWLHVYSFGRIFAWAPPLFGHWLPRVGWGSPVAVLLAVLVVARGPELAERLPRRLLYPLTWAAAVVWTLALALVNGWQRGLAGQFTSSDQYLRDVPRVRDDLLGMLPGFTSHILAGQPGNWITQVSGHPPGALLVFAGLDRIGLGGGTWAALTCVFVGSLAAVAVPATLHALGTPAAARAAVPFAVLFPGAIFLGAAADGLFTGVTTTAIALLAHGATAWRPPAEPPRQPGPAAGPGSAGAAARPGSAAGRSVGAAGQSGSVAGRSVSAAGQSGSAAGRSVGAAGQSGSAAGRSVGAAGRSASAAAQSVGAAGQSGSAAAGSSVAGSSGWLRAGSWRGWVWCGVGGLLLGCGMFLSYGLVLMAPIALAACLLAAGRRFPVPVLLAAVGAGIVVVLFAANGFWWLDGYHLVVQRYYQDLGRTRPYDYWVWADLAALVLSAGPVLAPGLRRAAWSFLQPALARSFADRLRAVTPAAGLALAAALAIAAADYSGMSKAEVERIWLPFAVWLTASAVLLPAASRRWWLGAQALTGLLVAHLVMTNW
jgi:methylthioxylose transferase